MYVRVKYQNKKYYSYVFAHFEYDYMPYCVVFNNEENKFEIVSNLSKKSGGVRQIGYMNESEEGFIKKREMNINLGVIRKCFGYPWLINNEELLRSIEEGLNIDEEYLKLAKEMNESIDKDAWNNVENEIDAEFFMEHVGAFHDSYLVGIEGFFNDLDLETPGSLKLRFTTGGEFDVLVEFIGSVKVKYLFTTCNRIYLSSVIFFNNSVYWVDGNDELTSVDIEDYDYISSEKLRWKFIEKD